MHILPTAWLLAFATAVWFGWSAYRSGRAWYVWAFAGGLFGLVTATLVLGLAQAEFIPYTHHFATMFILRWTLTAIFCIALLGSLFTVGFYYSEGRWQPRWRRGTKTEVQKPVVL
jgi:hypothetical protein